jgi:hypothetical protein
MIKLTTGDKVKFNGLKYKVMGVKDCSYLPQMGFSLQRFKQNITLIKIDTKIVDFEAQNTEIPISFMGIVQPLKYSELALKPEEQRSWKWLQVHQLLSKGWMEYQLLECYENST